MKTPIYTTKKVGHREGMRLEILADGKPWGERFPGRHHFDLTVREAEAAVLAWIYMLTFRRSDGEPIPEETYIPENAPLDRLEIRIMGYWDFDSDRRSIKVPYLEVHIGRSRRMYDLQMVEALVVSEDAIRWFVVGEHIIERDPTAASLSDEALGLKIHEICPGTDLSCWKLT